MYAAAKNYNKEQQQIIHMSKSKRKLIQYMSFNLLNVYFLRGRLHGLVWFSSGPGAVCGS
jgi:hypothetical protein